jgi:arsenite methyltransferase
MRKPNYGIDAPGLVRFFFAAGSVSVALFFIFVYMFESSTLWSLTILILLGLISCYLMGMGGLMLLYSKVIKLKDRDFALNQILWLGNEKVLDVGCGRGLMVVGAAKRLTAGKAVGVDIWSAKDQSSNSSSGAYANAALEGVADRVELATADARDLPYDSHSYDVVMSHWVFHNIEKPEDRYRALSEMVRVLKSGGHLLLGDIEHRETYRSNLTDLEMHKIQLLFNPIADRILRLVSFGSFAPSTIVAQKK